MTVCVLIYLNNKISAVCISSVITFKIKKCISAKSVVNIDTPMSLEGGLVFINTFSFGNERGDNTFP